MSLLSRALRYAGKLLVEELIKSSASSAGTKIGEALGHRVGKRIDPSWTDGAIAPETKDDEK